jgi:hypothetical protein
MAYIYIKNGTLYLSNDENNSLYLSKSRVEGICIICNKSIPKKSYVFGKGFCKVCLNCCESYFDNLIKTFEENKQRVITTKETYLKDKSKCLKNNILANLEDKNGY